jgi:hypothetical protein
MSLALKNGSCGHEKPVEAPPAAPARPMRRTALVVGIAGLLALSAAGLRDAWGQDPAPKKDDAPPKARWLLLFRSDNPALWNTLNRGKKHFAVPVGYAPLEMRYLRLRRLDTNEALILPLTRDELLNAKPRETAVGYWWSGTAKEEWKGRHLGISRGPRHKFPVPQGMICVMMDGWDAFAGSGFGHKAFVNDRQYYCWQGQEIRPTAFEIAVSEGPLAATEKRYLLPTR